MSKAKRAGTDNENRIVEELQAYGLPAARQPMSGMLKDFPNDGVVGQEVLIEAKVRTETLNASGQRYISFDCRWLEKVDENATRAGFNHGVVMVRRKRSATTLVVMPLTYYAELLREHQDYVNGITWSDRHEQ